MKKNILIPRKDHEIYFIPVIDSVKRKNLKTVISGRLRELHPGFSPSTVFDCKKITLNDKAWYVITVMQQETLMEYRLLYRKASFFTATSLLICVKDFIKSPPCHLPDETIGYDTEHETPISVPGVVSDNPPIEPFPPDRINKLLEQANGFQSIFKRKHPLVFASFFGIVSLAVLFFSLFFYGHHGGALFPAPPVQPEKPRLLQPVPTAFEILAQVASAVQSGEGIIHQIQYDESQPIVCTLNLNNIDPELLFERMASMLYIKPSGISDIQYIDDKPQYTAYIVLEDGLYHFSYASPFFDQEQLFSVLSTLRSRLRDYRVQLVSETLPQADSDVCTISLTVLASTFIKAIETIESELEINQLCIRRMMVSYDQDNAKFLLTYSFSPYQKTSMPVPLLSENKLAILPAFGYTPESVIQWPVVKTDYSAYTKVGVIHNEDGTITTYYRDVMGKIITSEE
jgi:hypothetical protein